MGLRLIKYVILDLDFRYKIFKLIDMLKKG